jgi:hypothetical protein
LVLGAADFFAATLAAGLATVFAAASFFTADFLAGAFGALTFLAAALAGDGFDFAATLAAGFLAVFAADFGGMAQLLSRVN